MKNGVSNANIKKKVLIMISLTIVFHVHQSHFFFGSLPCRGSLYDYEVRFPDATLSVTCEYSHPRAS